MATNTPPIIFSYSPRTHEKISIIYFSLGFADEISDSIQTNCFLLVMLIPCLQSILFCIYMKIKSQTSLPSVFDFFDPKFILN